MIQPAQAWPYRLALGCRARSSDRRRGDDHEGSWTQGPDAAIRNREGGFRMPLNLYPNIYASGSIPNGWTPTQGGTVKYPVRNKAVLKHLQSLLSGRWRKVIKKGTPGEVHYFEHESGQVAGVKHLP